jgi:hypothetical protein
MQDGKPFVYTHLQKMKDNLTAVSRKDPSIKAIPLMDGSFLLLFNFNFQ